MSDPTVEDSPVEARDLEAPPWTRRLEATLEDWRQRAWAAQMAHYRMGSRLRRQHVYLGVPLVILSTAVGTSLFATLNEEQLTLALRATVGGISALAAVLASLTTFFGFAERAEKHVLAADWYAAIRRKIEQTQALPPHWRGNPKDVLDAVRKEMNNVSSQFPEIGTEMWAAVSREFGIALSERPADQPATVGTAAQ